MQDIDATVLTLQQAYRAAVYDKDVPSFLSLYDPAVRVFDAWGVWEHEGAAAWREAVESWFSSLGDERVRVDFEATRASGSGEVGFASATVTYTAVSDAGVTLRSMQNRLSWGFRHDGQKPVVLHEHTSAPIGFDDRKAILRRPPLT